MFVSVIMAAYNAERFVGDAIESVLRQTHSDFEFIVVDDGSTDRTPEILARYAEQDRRLRVITQENRGAGAARNAAVSAARSEWIAVMDSDDVMEPQRLERQIAFVEQHSDVAIASCLVTWINQEGSAMGRSQSELTTDNAVQATLRKNQLLLFCHPGCLIRRSMILDVGGYRGEFWPSEDIDLFSRIADAGGRILVQPERLLRYRVHPKSGTGLTSGWDSTLHQWIRQCSLHRKQGLKEPTLDEYLFLRRQVPWYRRINQRRRDLANILYNKATFSYSVGHVVMPALLVAISSLLDPLHAPRQVWRKFVRPRIFGDSGTSRAVQNSVRSRQTSPD